MLAPALTALILGGYGLGRLSLWRDEAYTVDAAHRSLAQIIATAGTTDAVNSTYYLLMHVDIALLGASTVALRVPSLLAMAAAATVTAVIGRRLAQASALPAPALTGLAAGLLLATAPLAGWYIRDARAYAIVTLGAAASSYLLLRCLDDGRWRWWAGYSAVIAVTALFNLLSLALLAAHGATMLIVRARQGARAETAARPAPRLSRWLAAAGAAVLAVAPLILVGYHQRGQISWIRKPGLGAVSALVAEFSGSRQLVPAIGFLALIAVAASAVAGRRLPLDVPAVALPWVALPPAILLLASERTPVYDARYVAYCLPAVALLAAAGLAVLAKLAARTPLRREGLSWLPSGLAVVGVAVLLAGPQRIVHTATAHVDNLRQEAAILAAHERPGDAIVYLPVNQRVDEYAYPGPFRTLRDVALRTSPAAAGNLVGVDVTARVLRQRFAGVRRVWVIGEGMHLLQRPGNGIQKAEAGLLARMRLAGQWRAGVDTIRLYVRGG